MKQTKILAGFAAVIAIALVIYIGVYKINWGAVSSSQDSSSDGSRDILSYVPSDTLFFFGNQVPVTMKDTASIMNTGGNWMQFADFSDQPDLGEQSSLPQAALMASSILNRYMKLLQTPETASSTLGIADPVDAVSYTVGFIPVLRIKLSDVGTFNKFIDEIEQQQKIIPVKSSLGEINLRSYSFDVAGSSKKSDTHLVIGTSTQYAVFSLSTKIEDEKTRLLIVGTTRPDKPLDAKQTLELIQHKYSFHPAYIGFVNHTEIAKGLTGEGNGEFARMLETVISMSGQPVPETESSQSSKENDPAQHAPAADNQNPLQTIRTQDCQKELMSIISLWPQTVFGYTKLDVSGKPTHIEARMIIESTDSEYINSMQNIRGYIPAVLQDVSEKPVFGFGLGINIDALSPFIAQSTQGFSSKEYKCDFLDQIKQSLIQSNPAMALGMMSGMASGVKGVSLIVLDIDGNLNVTQPGAIPELKRLDAIFIITSTNPEQLLTTISNFQPGLPPLQLPPDGTPIDFPVPLPVPADHQLKLALKGKHIVVYVGDKATAIADALASQQPNPSGIFAINIDFGKYMSLIATAAKVAAEADANSQSSSLSKDDQSMLEAMGKTKMQLVESMDIKTEGIVFDVKMISDQ